MKGWILLGLGFILIAVGVYANGKLADDHKFKPSDLWAPPSCCPAARTAMGMYVGALVAVVGVCVMCNHTDRKNYFPMPE